MPYLTETQYLEFQEIFQEYERINLKQGDELKRLRLGLRNIIRRDYNNAREINAAKEQEIARLRELHKAVKIVVTAHKEVMNKNNWRACQCKVCLIFAPLLMGETLPAADEVNLNEKGN